jgi:NADPH2:quinone reductase
LGATVIATAGSDAKCAIAKAQGADYTINYTVDKDWVKTVNQITSKIPGRNGKKGADVIYDPVSSVSKFAG